MNETKNNEAGAVCQAQQKACTMSGQLTRARAPLVTILLSALCASCGSPTSPATSADATSEAAQGPAPGPSGLSPEIVVDRFEVKGTLDAQTEDRRALRIAQADSVADEAVTNAGAETSASKTAWTLL